VLIRSLMRSTTERPFSLLTTRTQVQRVRFKRRPTPPPFSGMNSTPERSNASTSARLFIVESLASSPLTSNAPIVDFETPETRASSF
jgi:hypothetical protein